VSLELGAVPAHPVEGVADGLRRPGVAQRIIAGSPAAALASMPRQHRSCHHKIDSTRQPQLRDAASVALVGDF